MLNPAIVTETIFAPSTPVSGSPFAILRIAGPNALDPVLRWTNTPLAPNSECKCWATNALLRILAIANPIPAEVCVWNSHHSPIGQPLVEITLPGSRPLLNAVMAELMAFGLRLAAGGEFSMRRFLAGKIDLASAEGILQLIAADTPTLVAKALDRTTGDFSRRVARLREAAVDLLADVEAGLDFVDEDIQFIDDKDLQSRIASLQRQIAALLQGIDGRRLGGNDIRVVLEGPPNAGKSSLFNALLGKPAALVSPVAGTTRDSVSGDLTLFGRRLVLVDTAGDGTTLDALADEAAHAGERECKMSDIRLICNPAGSDAIAPNVGRGSSPVLFLRTKSDLAPEFQPADHEIAISLLDSKSEDSVVRVRQALSLLVSSIEDGAHQVDGELADSRAFDVLSQCQRALSRATQFIDSKRGHEYVAMELRDAIDHFGVICGETFTEELLDRIFGRFCIGK